MRGVTGTVVDMTADTVFIVRWHQAPRTAIAVDKLSRLEVSAGKNRCRGMVRGGAIGLVLGGLMGVRNGRRRPLENRVQDRVLRLSERDGNCLFTAKNAKDAKARRASTANAFAKAPAVPPQRS